MRRIPVVLCLSALSLGTRLSAQCPHHPDTPMAAGGKTLVGIVADTSEMAVDSADVLIVSEKKETFTNAKGTFRFGGLKAGSYEVTARRFGFLPQVRTIVVGDTGGVGAFCLVPYARGLPPVVSSAKGGGLTRGVRDRPFPGLPLPGIFLC